MAVTQIDTRAVVGAAVEEALEAARGQFHAGELKQAERVCRGVLQVHPNHPGALYRLSRITLAAGIPGLAIAFASRALELEPNEPSFHRALGDALRSHGKSEQAKASLRRALELAPDDSRVYQSLSSALVDQMRVGEALETLQLAIERKPTDAYLHQAAACVQLMMGRAIEAVASFRKAAQLSPEQPNFSAGVLFSQHYLSGIDPQASFVAARAWATRYADPLGKDVAPHRNDPDPTRRLRIGYLSGDFQQHPVSRVLQAVLPAHDPAEVEVFCYATRRCVDQFAKQLALATDHWRSVVELGDEAAAELIRSDEIDILIDLSGHTAQNRLLALARKPAPVQAVWLGYFDTTGMSSIDYILADRFVCPPGDEAFYVEDVVRLPESFLCYRPTDSSPEVASLPMLSRCHVTFGSLNNIAKVGPEVVALWAEILRCLPDARLVLKYFGLVDVAVRDDFLGQFGGHGIASERITLLGTSPLGEHLATYHDIDIALDPFPYNGGVTTLDALWMGVPVVSLSGDRFVGRMSASSLSILGLQEMIATTPAEYVDCAIHLASDPDRLIELRGSLRQRMLNSPLCNGPALARALETCYRTMWQAWCRSHGAEGA